MQEIFVMGSIFSTHPILTSGIHKAQLPWAHSLPDLVAFMAPPFLGHNLQLGVMFMEQVRQSQGLEGMHTNELIIK